MKNILFYLLVALYSTHISAQNKKEIIEINYETKIISDSLNKEKFNLFTSTLLCDNTKSIYFNKEAKAFYEGTSTQTVNTSIGAIPRYPKSVASVYKENDIIIASLPVGKYIFTFEEPKLKWEILKEIKEIKSYKVRLAKTITDTGDIFFAWFTNDIPISEGPFRFKGLSGLVLEVYNQNKTIEIYATDIKKSEDAIMPLNYGDDIKVKSKTQFLEARKNYSENPSMYNGNLKILDSNGNDKTKIMIDRLKRINVFLD